MRAQVSRSGVCQQLSGFAQAICISCNACTTCRWGGIVVLLLIPNCWWWCININPLQKVLQDRIPGQYSRVVIFLLNSRSMVGWAVGLEFHYEFQTCFKCTFDIRPRSAPLRVFFFYNYNHKETCNMYTSYTSTVTYSCTPSTPPLSSMVSVLIGKYPGVRGFSGFRRRDYSYSQYNFIGNRKNPRV